MAKLTAGLLGYTQGKVAGVQCQRLRDSIILRAKQPPLGPAKGGQIAYRAKFAAVMSQNCKPVGLNGTLYVNGSETLLENRNASLRFNYTFNKTGTTKDCVTFGQHQYNSRLWRNECELVGTSVRFYLLYTPPTEGLSNVAYRAQRIRGGEPYGVVVTRIGSGTNGETTWSNTTTSAFVEGEKVVITFYAYKSITDQRFVLLNAVFDVGNNPVGSNWWGEVPYTDGE